MPKAVAADGCSSPNPFSKHRPNPPAAVKCLCKEGDCSVAQEAEKGKDWSYCPGGSRGLRALTRSWGREGALGTPQEPQTNPSPSAKVGTFKERFTVSKGGS